MTAAPGYDRPDPSEYAPYYAGYIAAVPDGELLGTLGRQLEDTAGALVGRPASRGSFAYAPGKWSIKEVLWHVADLIEELRAVRAATLALPRHLPPEAPLRRGTASGKEVSVRALAWIITGHERHHLRILRERYLG